MRRINIAFVCIMMVFMMSSCNRNAFSCEVRGIENFSDRSSETGLLENMLPCEDFISKYPYNKGDYYYRDYGFERSDFWGHEYAIIYMEYSEDTYDEAYSFVTTNVELSEKETYIYKSYTFSVNLTAEKADLSRKNGYDPFPEFFKMVFWSDEKNTIGFISFYCKREEQKYSPDKDFEKFLKNEIQHFDWDA